MMGEIKELEEARRSIAYMVTFGQFKDENRKTRLADLILNLKGDGWKIAIVGNWSYTNPDGNKYAQVIWQAGE